MSTRRYKIRGMPTDKELSAMPFGRQLEHIKTLAAFKAGAQSRWISIKRRSAAAAIKEAVSLEGASEWYCEYRDEPMYRDDSIQLFYKPKE
ncbi:MAG: hypothetical protein E6R03_07230 [Hyphomicrobiaceae bacterium]|nr:MAG: hypothetical protein E6R03_07230 [Hyphomicrobiaceae bacterium]